MSKRNKIKNKKERSKVLLFLVEGKSDKLTLETSIEKIVDEMCGKSVVVKFTTMVGGGDATADMNYDPKRIEEEITHYIEKNTDDNEFIYPKQVVKMIHIVDMDGAYITEDGIIQRSSCPLRAENRKYYEDKIETDNYFATVTNLKRKRTNLDYLSSISSFKLGSNNVDYRIYFFSTNLEHYLYGKRNYDDQVLRGGKVEQAKRYSKACSEDENYFYDTMIKSEFALRGKTYRESWDFIRQRGTRSLSRYSNINLMIEDLHLWADRFMCDSD